MSKRKLMALVQDGLVDGWDDPRMPTLRARAGAAITPAAICACSAERAGITKQNSVIDFGGARRLRARGPGQPARSGAWPCSIRSSCVISNLAGDHDESLDVRQPPEGRDLGTRRVPFSAELWIEREDFMEVPAKGFHRLMPGGEVRLRGVGIVKCEERGQGRRARGRTALHAGSGIAPRHGRRRTQGQGHHPLGQREARASRPRCACTTACSAWPTRTTKRRQDLSRLPESRHPSAWCSGFVEPAAAQSAAEQTFQFERLGYFVADRHDHRSDAPVFNRTVTLRDSWAKAAGA